jgi:hypothetical protein
LRALGFTFLGLGVIAFIARIVLVSLGVLFGDQAVNRVDVIVASVFGIALAFIVFAGPPQSSDGKPTRLGLLNERVSIVTGIVSVGALVIASVNLFVPVQLPSRPRAACPGAQDRAAPYIGITANETGNNSRQGPAVSFPANGRYPGDCTIGFSHYCIGDPIKDANGSIDGVQRWMTSRWLAVAKQPPGWRSALAQAFSDENPEPQYITDANITPATSYEKLSYGGDTSCAGKFELPGPATLTDLDVGTRILGAQADHAVNMGFAVWVPPGDAFIDGDSYHQIFDRAGTEGTNPGATQADGSKKVVWNYDSLLKNRRPESDEVGVVVIMAIPCLADNIPADTKNAVFANYDVTTADTPQKVTSDTPVVADQARLARAACQANT